MMISAPFRLRTAFKAQAECNSSANQDSPHQHPVGLESLLCFGRGEGRQKEEFTRLAELCPPGSCPSTYPEPAPDHSHKQGFTSPSTPFFRHQASLMPL